MKWEAQIKLQRCLYARGQGRGGPILLRAPTECIKTPFLTMRSPEGQGEGSGEGVGPLWKEKNKAVEEVGACPMAPHPGSRGGQTATGSRTAHLPLGPGCSCSAAMLQPKTAPVSTDPCLWDTAAVL